MNFHFMFAALIAPALLVGCASQPKQLYMWGSFPKIQYEALQGNLGTATDKIAAMDAHAEKARASNAALPPGFRAHLGMLNLSEGNVDRARQLWIEEKTVFPESASYIDQLLNRLDRKPTDTEKPA